MTPVTVKQRVELARLRIYHPRATVTVPARQKHHPAVRIRMRWPDVGKQRRLCVLWIHPDGRRETRAPW